jgi:hypothetical protein
MCAPKFKSGAKRVKVAEAPPAPSETATRVQRVTPDATNTTSNTSAADGLDRLRVTLAIPDEGAGLNVPGT